MLSASAFSLAVSTFLDLDYSGYLKNLIQYLFIIVIIIIIIIIIVVVIIHNFNLPRERVIVADSDVMSTHGISQFQVYMLIEGPPGGGATWVNFCWICAAGSQRPYPILVYFLANDRPHLSHFLENVIFAIPT